MSGTPSPFATPAWWLSSAHLAVVKSVLDPEGKGRVQVQLHGPDPEGEALVWARVAVPFAGSNYGAFLLPDVDEQVLVVFSGGDVRYPIVIGSLWTGADDLPEELVRDNVDRWTLTGKRGTRIAIVEENDGQAKVEIETPNGATATLTDDAGGEITLTVGSNTLTMDTGGISLETSGEFSVQASTITMNGCSVTVTAGTSDFSGATSSASHQTSSVVSASYTPGAGNIW
jgi:uncharacterized protein involved in type VI secretion and phage assembly